MQCESAHLNDARDLAYLINLAGEGIPEYIWSEMAEPGQSPLDVGEQRARREEGDFSYRNARVIRANSELKGMVMSYQLDDPYIVEDIDALPRVIRPLIALEAQVAGSWYINAIATKANYRGQGVARALLMEAQAYAAKAGANRLSLIVASENSNAKSLYQFLGFDVVSSVPMQPWSNTSPSGQWELMVKPLS